MTNLKEEHEAIRQSSLISFFTPSIAAVIFISVFLSQNLTTAGLLQDCDTAYHIRAGEHILQTLSVPEHDIFSFHSPRLPWIAHEWLSESIMAAVHTSFGLNGIVIFFSMLIAAVYFFLFKLLQAMNLNIIIAAIIMIFVIISSQMHWLARPHIFSMVFILAWYFLLSSFQLEKKNILFLQIPLMLIWANMHAGFIIGLILNGVYLSGYTVAFIASPTRGTKVLGEKAVFLGLITIACLIISLVNPYGYHILLFPFKLVSQKLIMNTIGEYLSPNFHSVWAIPFELFLLFIVAVITLSKDRFSLIEILLILLFLHMSLFSARYIPLFGIITAPIVAKYSDRLLASSNGKWSKFFKKRGISFAEIDASGNNYLWPAIVVLTIVFLAYSGKLRHDFDATKKPVDASQFLKQEYIKGNMFNEDEFGDYIIYRNYPKYRVFIDGRNDMYGVEKVKEYLKVAKFEHGWENILRKYNIVWIIFDTNSTFSRFLVQNRDWGLIYSDRVASIFLKKIPDNKPLLQKYENVQLFLDE